MHLQRRLYYVRVKEESVIYKRSKFCISLSALNILDIVNVLRMIY